MKIAFVNTDMNVGGIPKASIPFLKELVKEHEVTLILTHGGGEILDQIPAGVKVRILPSLGYKGLLVSAVKQGRIFAAIKCLTRYKTSKNWIESLRAWVNINKRINGHFDLAIAYFGMNAKCVLVTLDQVNAAKKIAFMHGDHPFKESELPVMGKIYAGFDKLFSVSNATRLNFIKDYPSCKDKADVFYNLMDVELIKSKANELLPSKSFEDKDPIHIVTVGRVSPEKGQMMIPEISSLLQESGIKFIWHVIGAGPDLEFLRQPVEKRAMSETIILHGNAINPYPYIKAADIYVQPSYTEGYCLTILEAAILGKPIVATKVGGTWEHFIDGEDILLCQPTPEAIFDKVKDLATNEQFRRQIGINASLHDWSNISELHKLDSI